MTLDSVKSTAGATAMGAIVLALTWACATGIITTASRMTWSFARDRGTPWSSVISKVSNQKRIPVVAVGVVTTIAAVLNLIYIGSSTAFNDVISLTITGFYCSYFLPAALLLYHRIKGHIAPHQQDTPGIPLADESNSNPSTKPLDPNQKGEQSPEVDSDGPANTPAHHGRRSSVAQATLVWGPFHVPGLFGTLNNAYACVYMIFVIFWSVWPPALPVTYST
jgi:choline transport protein